MKTWIKNNLVSNYKLVGPNRTEKWFITNNYHDKYKEILLLTSFLDNINPKFNQRLWHINNDMLNIVYCKCCKNIPKFLDFTRGYVAHCSYKCAQSSKETKEKIEKTNMEKFGTPHPLMNKEIQEKAKVTNLEKYGVDNVSKSEEIKQLKRETNLKKFGVDTPFRDRKKMEESIMSKYGVTNVALCPEILKKRTEARIKRFYDELFDNKRFKGMVTPNFTIEEYNGTGWDKIYSFKCNMCNKAFDYPLRWDRVPRCPSCFTDTHTSLFEKEVYKYIKSILNDQIEIIENDRKVLDGKELDIYMPKLKLAIECDGLFYHSVGVGGKDESYHLDKTNRCEELGIDLIHIFENEWRNDSDIVKLMLNNIINGNTIVNKEYVIKDVSIEELNMFLFQYSLVKEENCEIILGAYNTDNILVAVMTISDNFTEYKINKFISNWQIDNSFIFNKMLNHFNDKHNDGKLSIYIDIDRKWNVLYKNIIDLSKWQLCRITPPQPFYFILKGNHNEFEVITEDIFNIDTDLKKEEWDKILDCGNFRYELLVN